MGRALASGALDAWFVDAVQAVDRRSICNRSWPRRRDFAPVGTGRRHVGHDSAAPMLLHGLRRRDRAAHAVDAPIVAAFGCFVLAFVATLLLF
ncbi:MAG: hypothetical protein R2854_11950 [Caldilineaceae bacterium]